jgi:hypothetical protein
MADIENLESDYEELDKQRELEELFKQLRDDLGLTEVNGITGLHHLTAPELRVYQGEAPRYEGRIHAFLLTDDIYFMTEAAIRNRKPLPTLDDIQQTHQHWHTAPDQTRAIREGLMDPITLPQLYWMVRRKLDWAENHTHYHELPQTHDFVTYSLTSYRHIEETLRPLVTPYPEAGPPVALRPEHE